MQLQDRVRSLQGSGRVKTSRGAPERGHRPSQTPFLHANLHITSLTATPNCITVLVFSKVTRNHRVANCLRSVWPNMITYSCDAKPQRPPIYPHPNVSAQPCLYRFIRHLRIKNHPRRRSFCKTHINSRAHEVPNIHSGGSTD